jgi:hypothetical protein
MTCEEETLYEAQTTPPNSDLSLSRISTDSEMKASPKFYLQLVLLRGYGLFDNDLNFSYGSRNSSVV